jgi:hypothetical protein
MEIFSERERQRSDRAQANECGTRNPNEHADNLETPGEAESSGFGHLQ